VRDCFDDDLPETPAERRVRARLASGEIVEYRDLRRGMVFQSVLPSGEVVHPITMERDPETFAVCTGDPLRNYELGEGWGVIVETGPLELATKRSG